MLVVDDNVDMAESTAGLLQLWGYEVRNARSAEAAVTMTAAHPPDIVLLDIALPGVNGYELAKHLRAAHSKDLCLIAVSGYGDFAHPECSQDAGIDHYLVKPPGALQVVRLREPPLVELPGPADDRAKPDHA